MLRVKQGVSPRSISMARFHVVIKRGSTDHERTIEDEEEEEGEEEIDLRGEGVKGAQNIGENY